MADSNQLHAICLDTFPPCVYMNQVSHQIVRLVHQINQVSNCTKVSYITNVCFIKIRTTHCDLGLYFDFFWQILIQYCKFLTPRPLKWGILGASTIILSKDMDKYVFMFGSAKWAMFLHFLKQCVTYYWNFWKLMI